MFISKSKYEELVKEKEQLKHRLSIKKAHEESEVQFVVNLEKRVSDLMDNNKRLSIEVENLRANKVLAKGIKPDDTEVKDNSFSTKTKAVKSHLLIKGNITSWEAIQKYNATRLSAIIFELKKKGMDITATPIQKGKSRFVRYHLNKAIK